MASVYSCHLNINYIVAIAIQTYKGNYNFSHYLNNKLEKLNAIYWCLMYYTSIPGFFHKTILKH